MLYTINRKQFVTQVLSDYCVWTDLIRDSENFNSKYYFDETNTFYMATNYGGGDVIVIFSPYAVNVLDRAKKMFPQAVGCSFACPVDDYNSSRIQENFGVTFHYKLCDLQDGNTIHVQVQKIVDEDSAEILKTYDDMYMSFLCENHGARLLNHWKREKDKIISGEKELYLAWSDQNVLIGFAMVNNYKSLHACDITQITIEDAFQNQGYGKQFLGQVVRELQRNRFDIYYSSVNGDNVASQKTAESVGFRAVACRIQIIS